MDARNYHKTAIAEIRRAMSRLYRSRRSKCDNQIRSAKKRVLDAVCKWFFENGDCGEVICPFCNHVAASISVLAEHIPKHKGIIGQSPKVAERLIQTAIAASTLSMMEAKNLVRAEYAWEGEDAVVECTVVEWNEEVLKKFMDLSG